MRKTIAAIAIASGALTGVAQADVIVYQMSATISLTGGSDSSLLNGASFLLTCQYDDSGVYIDRFGLPTVDGTGTVTIAGSGNGANNTTVPFDTATGFYPTFAGNFSSPDGLHLTMHLGNGAWFQYYGNTSATPGAADAFVGGPIELDDFAPGASYTGSGLLDLDRGGTYALNNVEITADYIPAPGALALLGLGGLAASRRRR